MILEHPHPVDLEQHIDLPVQQEADKQRAALLSLRDEIHTSADTDDFVSDLLGVAQGLGNDALVDAAGVRGEQMYNVLERVHANRPVKDVLTGPLESDVATFRNGLVVIDPAKNKKDGQRLDSEIRAAGVKLRHPDDVHLIQFISTAAHEAGHGIDQALGKIITGPSILDGSQFGSYAYIKGHPLEGMAKNYELAAKMHAERFAQGYARLATERTLRLLGYSAREVRKIIAVEQKLYRTDRSGELGSNQIDFISDVDAATKIQGLQKDMIHGHTYAGALGYEFTLNASQMVDQILEMNTPDLAVSYVDEKQWGQEQQKMSRLSRTAGHIRRLTKDRRVELHGVPLRRRLARQAGGVVLGAVVATGVGGAFYEGSAAIVKALTHGGSSSSQQFAPDNIQNDNFTVHGSNGGESLGYPPIVVTPHPNHLSQASPTAVSNLNDKK